jgi:hypothetical protein
MKMDTLISCIGLGSMLALSGCMTTTLDEPLPPANQVEDAANSASNQGGISAIGICTTHTVEMAIMRSKERGRIALAAAIEARVAELKELFNQEVDASQHADTTNYFDAVAKSLSLRAIRAAVPQDVKTETLETSTTAWSLFVQDPKPLLDAFDREGATYRAVHARFKASQAYRGLRSDIANFDAFKSARARELHAQK